MAKKPTENQSPADSILAANTSFTLTLAWSEVEKTYARILARQAARVKAPGFRQGKVPPQIAEGIIGQNKLIEATVDTLLPEAYTAEVKKLGYTPITQPDIRPKKIEMGSDWELDVQIAQRPEVKLGKYQDLVKKAKKDAEKEIAELEKKQAEAAKEAEKAKKASKDKDAAETSEKTDKTAVNPANLTGMTDEQRKDVVLKTIFKALVTEIKPMVPELLLREETRRELDNLVHNLEHLKLSLDEYLERRQISFDDLSTEIAATLLGQIQIEFILDEISKTNKFTVEEAEIAEVAGRIEDAATREAQLKDERYHQYVRASLLRQKTVDHLLAQ